MTGHYAYKSGLQVRNKWDSGRTLLSGPKSRRINTPYMPKSFIIGSWLVWNFWIYIFLPFPLKITQFPISRLFNY